MSLSRQFFRELRPLFHMLEEPLVRSSFTGPASLTPFARSRGSPFAVFNDPFFQNSLSSNVPAVDVTEEPGAFVVEAELPGVKKENVDLRIGDGGQSLTIEGRTFFQSTPPEAASAAEGQQAQQATSGQPEITDSSSAPVNGDSQAVTQAQINNSTALSTERMFSGESSFSRTIWLPRRVDSAGVAAKLEDGILTIHIPKAEDLQSVKINID